ncbi:MAG TPA: hypothetical protein QF716_00910 [Candidatus Thalassarchaeaceae archaeon]|nr:hypothetical protein [Candidatus Thalassarchaeaceae archaeon]HJM67420.1 hypothetical protein [Candidatus Thalassarchaeaceae archaeon]
MGSRTPDDARMDGGKRLDWEKIELVSIPEDEKKGEPEPILAGLVAKPSDLHDAFLSDIPHLAEAQAAHASVVETAGRGVEAHFAEVHSIQTADVAIANLGGFREGDALVIPLSGAIHERVQLEMGEQGDGKTLRLNAEGNGGVSFTRTFTLPPGTELARAGWRGSELILDLVRN